MMEAPQMLDWFRSVFGRRDGGLGRGCRPSAKCAFFAFALLLAFSPASAHAGRILWISVVEDAPVCDAAGNELGTTVSTYRFQPSDHVLNAAKVSVTDASGGSSSYLLIVYKDPDTGRVVTDDPESHTVELSFGQDSGSGSGSSSGSSTDSDLTSSWIPFYLPGNSEEGSGDLNVTLELGHVDWDAVQTAYDADPTAQLTIEFERLAIATAPLMRLQADNNVSPVASTAPPGYKPWTPTSYTAVPEPGTVGIALLGAVLLLKRRRPGAAAPRAA